MNQTEIEKASHDLLMVVKYFKVIPHMIGYLPETAQDNTRDITLRIITALEDLNKFICNVKSENHEYSCRN